MWFKIFLIARVPVSALCLLGYLTATGIWEPPEELTTGAIMLAPYVFLAYVSSRLVMLKPGALHLAGWLLALEVVGAVLWVAGGNYLQTGIFDPATAAGVVAVVGVVWTLPNAVILYSQRAKFAQVETNKKPGA